MIHNYNNIKYDKLDNLSDCSGDDVPLLSLDERNNNRDNNRDNDSDSILLDLNQNINQNINQNNQKEQDNSSRNIIRLYIVNIFIISISFTFIILGYKDLYNTPDDLIIFNDYGKLLFKYYYIVNICFYFVFLLFSVYLLLYI